MTLKVCGNCNSKLTSKNDWIYKIISENDILCPHCGVFLPLGGTFSSMDDVPKNIIKLNDKINSIKQYV